MDNVIAPSKAKQTAPKQEQADPVSDKAKSIAAQAAQEQAEYDAIHNADIAFSKAIAATGFNVLARLAKEYGMTVDKFGYPALSAWRRFTGACAIRALDHSSFNRLCAVIRANVGTDPDRKMSDEDIKAGKEKCVRDKGKGSNGKSSMTLSLKSPKAWDIALGE
jgi:hypothetical protein